MRHSDLREKEAQSRGINCACRIIVALQTEVVKADVQLAY